MNSETVQIRGKCFVLKYYIIPKDRQGSRANRITPSQVLQQLIKNCLDCWIENYLIEIQENVICVYVQMRRTLETQKLTQFNIT